MGAMTPWPIGIMERALDDSDRGWWSRVNSGSIDEAVALVVVFRLRRVSDGVERTVIERQPPTARRPPDEMIGSIGRYYTDGGGSCGCHRKVQWDAAYGGAEYKYDDECEQLFEVTWPPWLVACQENPFAEWTDPPPWRR